MVLKIYQVFGKVDIFEPYYGCLMLEGAEVKAASKEYAKVVLATKISFKFNMKYDFVIRRINNAKLIIKEK